MHLMPSQVLAIIGGCTDTPCKKACLASFGDRDSNFLTVLQHIVGSEYVVHTTHCLFCLFHELAH